MRSVIFYKCKFDFTSVIRIELTRKIAWYSMSHRNRMKTSTVILYKWKFKFKSVIEIGLTIGEFFYRCSKVCISDAGMIVIRL